MRKLPEDEGTLGSAGKSVRRKGRPKTTRSPYRVAASPAKTIARTRSRPRKQEGSLLDLEAGASAEGSSAPAGEPVPPVTLLAASEPSAPIPPESDLQKIEYRMQRLEAGLRLMGQTFKRAFAELSGAIDSLREDVARTATSEDLRRALIKGDLADRISAPPAAIQAAVERLSEGIAAAQVMVDEAGGSDVAQDLPSNERDLPTPGQALKASFPERGAGKDPPDPAAIWGEENGTDSALGEAGAGPRNHRKRSATRRRLEKTWPGRAYAQWKWRRT